MKFCPKCSTEFEDKLNFCRNDGTALQVKALGRVCPKCGKEAEQGKKFCRHCGARLDVAGEPPPTKVEKPEVQEVFGQQRIQPEPPKLTIEENVAEKIERQIIQRQQSAEQSVTKHGSSVEAAGRHLRDGNYKDAIAALEAILKNSPENQEAWLLHLLASVKLYNVYGYEKQIESIRSLANLSEKERELAREIFLIRFEEARKRSQEDEAREYQRLASRVMLGQPLTEPPPKAKADETPVQRREVKPFPERKAEKIPQTASMAIPSAPDKIASLPRHAAEPRKKRVSGISITLGVVLGVAGILGGGALAYYAKIQGVNITGLFGKMFPGTQQPGREVRTSGRTDVAQVLAAEELGFKVWGTGAVDVNRRESLLSEKIESQLDNLRKFYQQQIQKKPELMGSMTVQLTIAPSGQVTKVEEFYSVIKDREFKKSVIGEVYKWRFPEATAGLVKVNYPLLFLPPNMDVATLIKWEQSIGPRVTEATDEGKPPPSGGEAEGAGQLTTRGSAPSEFAEARRSPPSVPSPQPRFADTNASPPVSSPAPPPQQPPVAPPRIAVREQYEVLYPTSVYREPREDSQKVASLPAGIKVNIVAVRGDWLEVRSKHGNPPGFIKKDSAALVSNR
jgi:tetratricopeptide (TPR) repeat protein